MTVPTIRSRRPRPLTPQPATRRGHARLDARICLVGTYPPTACGIASFTASLRSAMALHRGGGEPVDVVRVTDSLGPDGASPEVAATLRPDDPRSVAEAASILSLYDAVIVQHEFGIYGTRSGAAVLDLIDGVSPPVVVTLHTVSDRPTEQQRRIIARLADLSARTVVLSQTAASLLVRLYGADPDRVDVIPHGTEALGPVHERSGDGGPTLLTWGLIGPGKGLEWAVLGVDGLRRAFPCIRYVIAGRTHPKVAARDGESYRHALHDMVHRLGLESHVTMIDEYLPRHELHDVVRRASIVVLPYESTEQTSSGVLMEAVTAGIPIVATDFPHAREIERMGGAVTVPHRDPSALARRVEALLRDPAACMDMVAAQRALAPTLEWRNVGARYLEIVREIMMTRP